MSARREPSWFVGLIGFSYPEWGKTIYRGVPGERRLARYAEHFNAVEVNTTFYGVPSVDTVRMWAGATPAGFRFCVKMPRDVTHGPTPPGALANAEGSPAGHLLREETVGMAQELIETVRPLGEKLGAVLLQFPARFTAERRDELAEFLERIGNGTPLAVELRHESWWKGGTAEMLKERGVCWVGADESPRLAGERAPGAGEADRGTRAITATTDFLYVRWLGRHDQFTDRSREYFDPTARLGWWVERVRGIVERSRDEESLLAGARGSKAGVKTVYGFFDNDFAGHAPLTARRFADLVGLAGRRVEVEGPGLFG